MATWTEGYVSDIQYTAGFYRETAPLHLAYAAQSLGVRPPDFNKPFTYLELGCGQGFGTSLLAAAMPTGSFYGIDFNPAQIANANALAQELGLGNVTFQEDSFADMADGTSAHEYPPFDVISLHGIYSWISPENRQAIVRVINRFLKPGGLVYVSYNAMPGWIGMLPFQRLLREYAERNPGRSDQQFDKAYDFIQDLIKADAKFFQHNPVVKQRIEKISNMNRHYLTHEYLNAHWNPLYVTEVAEEMSAAKLSFIGSATIADNIEPATISAQIGPIHQRFPDPLMRELVKDFAINQQFRRDIYVRGANQMPRVELENKLHRQQFTLCVPRKQVKFKFATGLGEATGNEKTYGAIADALATGVKSLIELQQLPTLNEKERHTVTQAVAFLVSSGQAAPVLQGATQQQGELARHFNMTIARRASEGIEYNFVCAPLLASGLYVVMSDLIALPLVAEKKDIGADTLAVEVWKVLSRLGRNIVRDGKQLEGTDANVEALVHQMVAFTQGTVPLWRRLGVI